MRNVYACRPLTGGIFVWLVARLRFAFYQRFTLLSVIDWYRRQATVYYLASANEHTTTSH
ncbi:hypothetical protein H8F21_14655 [Pseudomonas sp. P66]|uniref:Uncharacterized protein n=1 Tax=Pseudomonas arcuscaelestis TaxID=2710591 RepID=A0ABS2BYU9_9PSED|nr:hypothetical protein [Pseudomonas arcuscaelestis]MBM5458806.1 hypothetical protein [Pseudomonas arcuscaelestis]